MTADDIVTQKKGAKCITLVLKSVVIILSIIILVNLITAIRMNQSKNYNPYCEICHSMTYKMLKEDKVLNQLYCTDCHGYSTRHQRLEGRLLAPPTIRKPSRRQIKKVLNQHEIDLQLYQILPVHKNVRFDFNNANF